MSTNYLRKMIFHNDEEPILKENATENMSTNFGAKMIHKDDEPIPEKINATEKKADLKLDGYTEARIFNQTEAPMGKNQFKVLLELNGVGSSEERLGVDLVTVLDISESMKGAKLAKMKLAMQFLLQKLGPNDRLSVVAFNIKPNKLCPLRQITENSRTEIADKVNALVAVSRTDTEAGLKMALAILSDRTHTKGRRGAIMLMSDGGEVRNSHSASIPFGEVPVYTFGFGSDCDSGVLNDIANNSSGGMFAPVDDLTVDFSMSLAELLKVVIEDLTLTITPENGSEIAGVNAGNYPQKKGSVTTDPVSVTFPSLYEEETRKVLVTLILPKVDDQYDEQGAHVLTMDFKYRVGRMDKFKADVKRIHVTRIATENEAEEEKVEVVAEEKRIRTARLRKGEILMKNVEKLEEAREKLKVDDNKLDDVVNILAAQLNQLFEFKASQDSYDNQGRAFEASYDSQSGDTVSKLEMLKARVDSLILNRSNFI